LVENRRVNAHVKQETIAYMAKCPTIEEAYQYWKKIANSSIGRWVGEKFILSEYSPIDRFRAKTYIENLEEYRDKKAVRAEEKAAEERRRKREATPSYKKRKAEQEARNAEYEFRERYRQAYQQPHNPRVVTREQHLAALGCSANSTPE